MKDISACLYTDGACSGNPGPGGWGFVFVNFKNKKIFEGGGGALSTTNNRMEMQAIVEGMKEAHAQNIKNILILTDSTYAIRGYTQWRHGWKKRNWTNQEGEPVSNQDLWMEMEKAGQGLQIEWRYVRGHQGTPGNERVDEIAVAFSKKNMIHLYDNTSFNDYIFDVIEIPAGEALPEMKKMTPGEKKAVFYVSVVNGVLTRHADWASCERTVKGQPKALYKKVSNEEELKEVLKKWGISGN